MFFLFIFLLMEITKKTEGNGDNSLLTLKQLDGRKGTETEYEDFLSKMTVDK